MTSWDLFDTLVGRWYKDPKSIFYEVENISGVKDFAKDRILAEQTLYEKIPDVRLENIYHNYETLHPIKGKKAEELMHLELETELRMSFPIIENTKRVAKNDIVVSDMYLPPEFLQKILDKHHIGPVSEIFSVSGGKSSGKIWQFVRKTHNVTQHIGDNYQSDFMTARKFGIKGNLYRETRSIVEDTLEKMGFGRIANLSRVLRLSNPYSADPERAVWNEQAILNIPILILTSLYIPLIYKGRRVLMMTRDCNNLLRIFPLINPEIATEELYSSRKCLLKASDGYRDYFRLKLGIDNPLLVDLHATGTSKDNFYTLFGHAPNEFYIIQSSLQDRPYRNYIVHRSVEKMYQSGFLWEIENTNLDIVGSVIDVVDGQPIRDPIRYKTKLVDVQHQVVSACIDLLEYGFDVKYPNVYTKESIADAIVYLLKTLHNSGAIVTKYGIPDINDLALFR